MHVLYCKLFFLSDVSQHYSNMTHHAKSLWDWSLAPYFVKFSTCSVKHFKITTVRMHAYSKISAGIKRAYLFQMKKCIHSVNRQNDPYQIYFSLKMVKLNSCYFGFPQN